MRAHIKALMKIKMITQKPASSIGFLYFWWFFLGAGRNFKFFLPKLGKFVKIMKIGSFLSKNGSFWGFSRKIHTKTIKVEKILKKCMFHLKSSLDSEKRIKKWFKPIPGVEKLVARAYDKTSHLLTTKNALFLHCINIQFWLRKSYFFGP